MLLSVVLWFFAVLLCAAALLPLTKLRIGAVEGLAFPRQQFLGASLFVAIAFAVFRPDVGWPWGIALMIVTAAVQAGYVGRFTPFWSRQSLAADEGLRADADRRISLIAANVKMSNRDYGRLISLVHDKEPDVLMAIETDQRWIDALKEGLCGTYPHWIEVPMDNGYGLCVASRLGLTDVAVRELVTRDVPSIRATVTLRGGKTLRLYVVHPEPPVIDHDTLGRDSELALVGLAAAEDDLPCIVSGDLNDVAWSSSTRRFQRLSGLLDPRVGRGFYNTFSATMPWMRWPLDHLFHDPKFRLIEMQRERKIGSDHFPMWFALALAETGAVNNDPGEADKAEVVRAKREIVQERRRDRDPIGGDWEKD